MDQLGPNVLIKTALKQDFETNKMIRQPWPDVEPSLGNLVTEIGINVSLGGQFSQTSKLCTTDKKICLVIKSSRHPLPL